LKLDKTALILQNHQNLVHTPPKQALPTESRCIRAAFFITHSPGKIDMATIMVLNGPNLNLLGIREPDQYGHVSLNEIRSKLVNTAEQLGHEIDFRQSNAEHELLSWIHEAHEKKVAFIIINPAAFTHTSIALRDALLGTGIPYIEVHLSNVHAREEFRRHSYFSDKADGVIIGLGAQGYELALQAAAARLNK
jgi:3-dehydroquinate dehydratase-2